MERRALAERRVHRRVHRKWQAPNPLVTELGVPEGWIPAAGNPAGWEGDKRGQKNNLGEAAQSFQHQLSNLGCILLVVGTQSVAQVPAVPKDLLETQNPRAHPDLQSHSLCFTRAPQATWIFVQALLQAERKQERFRGWG